MGSSRARLYVERPRDGGGWESGLFASAPGLHQIPSLV